MLINRPVSSKPMLQTSAPTSGNELKLSHPTPHCPSTTFISSLHLVAAAVLLSDLKPCHAVMFTNLAAIAAVSFISKPQPEAAADCISDLKSIPKLWHWCMQA